MLVEADAVGGEVKVWCVKMVVVVVSPGVVCIGVCPCMRVCLKIDGLTYSLRDSRTLTTDMRSW